MGIIYFRVEETKGTGENIALNQSTENQLKIMIIRNYHHNSIRSSLINPFFFNHSIDIEYGPQGNRTTIIENPTRIPLKV